MIRRPSATAASSMGAALCAAALLVLPAPAGAADPFYLELLRAGHEAYARKDFPAAAEKLRLACFGFLEEPALLREGLMRLALAQAASGDDDGFLTTFSRVSDLERRFPEAAAERLPEDVRGPFETLALERVPAAQLAAIPALAALAEQRAAAALAALPPRQRRAELEKRATAAPTDARWALMLAQLDLEQGRPGPAAQRLGPVLALDSGNAQARCLRGRALAATGKCDEAAADLRACAASLTDRLLAGGRLECLVKIKSWAEGTEVATALPAALRQDPAIAKLVAKIAAGAAAAAPKSAPAPKVAASAPNPTSGPARPAKAEPKPAPGRRDRRPREAAAPPAATSGKPAAVKPPATATADGTVAGTPAAGTPTATAPKPPLAAPTRAAPSPAAPSPAAPAVEPVAPFLSSDDQEQLETARRLMGEARVAADLVEALRLASAVADRHPRDREAQLLTAEIAYRASKWPVAVRHFQRADPGDRQPALLFYYAVALFESGDRAGAAAILKRCLPDLERTPVVDNYAELILGSTPGTR